jgi:hypothetical protein
MKYLLSIEELATTIGSIYMTSRLDMHINWWVYALLFFTPDIGMIGYAVSTKAGAITYNLTHHKAIAIAIWLTGIFTANAYLEYAGLLLFAHSSFDRVLGYGLKYNDAFKHTHLGWMK